MSSAEATVGATGLNYGIDDVPRPFPRALGLGLQHVLTMFGATIAVPLILGPAMGMEAADLAILISSVFIASGIATIIQVIWGSRLPIVQGVSFAFLGPFFAIIAARPGPDAMRYIAGAILVGAVIEAAIGFSGLFGIIRRYITPVVIGPVVALIGLSLFPAAAGEAGLNWWLALLVVAGVFVYSLIFAPRNRFFSLFPILLAVLTAYAVALVLSLVGLIEEGSFAYVSFAGLETAPWVRNVVGVKALFFPWGGPAFQIGFIIAVFAAYLASMIESFGDYHAVSRVSGLGDPDGRTINRGIGAEGLGCFITGLVGGFASTSYTENIGLIGITKVASRYVVIVGAIALVVLGFVTKIGAVVATIPRPVVGGAYLALFGVIAAIGLSILLRADMTSQRNVLIAGFVLFMGLVVPFYFSGLPPEWTLLNQGWLTDLAKSIGGSGIAVGALLGLFLDNVIPGTDVERGAIGGGAPVPTTEASEMPGELGDAAPGAPTA